MANIRAGQRLTAQALAEIFGNVEGISVGTVTISPTPNTVTSQTVSGLTTPGTLHMAFVTANTTVPGIVEMISASGVTATSLTVNLMRANSTTTVVWWMHVGFS